MAQASQPQQVPLEQLSVEQLSQIKQQLDEVRRCILILLLLPVMIPVWSCYHLDAGLDRMALLAGGASNR